jgi:CBS domain-containing protein
MRSGPVFFSRLTRLPLLDNDGGTLGRIQDVLLVPVRQRLRVLGYIALVQRRRIFVNAARVADIDHAGLHLRGGAVDLRSFMPRPGERLVSELVGTDIHGETLTDVAIARDDQKEDWTVAQAALRSRRGPVRSASRLVPWTEVAHHFATTADQTEVAELRDLHPTDVVSRLRSLPLARSERLVQLLEDEQVADLIEQMDEDERVKLIESFDLERGARILEEMEPDDAVDLLADLPDAQRAALLAAMLPEESQPLERLLAYDEDTAGGLMTSEPVILTPTTTVAEALATIRRREIATELAAQVFVADPPSMTPTGRFRGTVGFQRLLREPPGTILADCVNEPEAVPTSLPLREVAERLASYDLMAVAVCDDAGRLVGAVTVDDVLDRQLPDGWRRLARR